MNAKVFLLIKKSGKKKALVKRAFVVYLIITFLLITPSEVFKLTI